MSSHQRGAKCCHWAWEGAPGPEAGAPETPGHVQPHSLLRESVTGRRASQALAFFIGSGPFSLEVISFTGSCLLHRLWAFSKKGRSSQALGLFQKGKVFTGVRLLHRLWAFSKKGRSSQAFTFFTGSGPSRGRTSGGAGCSTRSGSAPPLESPSARSLAWKHEQL